MFDYNNSTIVFLWVLAFYFLPMMVGFVLGKKKNISIAKMSEMGRKFGDPITKGVHNWSRKHKLASIKNGKWLFLFLLIFLNNLLLVAFASRIIYGIIFIIPLFLTAWTGFGQGALLSNPKGRAGIVLIFFEFGGYLFATVIGVMIGISVLASIIKGSQIIINIPWTYVVLMILFLLSGAAIETLSLKVACKSIDISEIEKADLDEHMREIAKQFDGHE